MKFVIETLNKLFKIVTFEQSYLKNDNIEIASQSNINSNPIDILYTTFQVYIYNLNDSMKKWSLSTGLSLRMPLELHWIFMVMTLSVEVCTLHSTQNYTHQKKK